MVKNLRRTREYGIVFGVVESGRAIVILLGVDADSWARDGRGSCSDGSVVPVDRWCRPASPPPPSLSSSSTQSSNGCSRSWVIKSEDLRRRYISLAEQHSSEFVGLIQVASLGADQFSFGKTFPPREEMVVVIREWVSGKRREGS